MAITGTDFVDCALRDDTDVGSYLIVSVFTIGIISSSGPVINLVFSDKCFVIVFSSSTVVLVFFEPTIPKSGCLIGSSPIVCFLLDDEMDEVADFDDSVTLVRGCEDFCLAPLS